MSERPESGAKARKGALRRDLRARRRGRDPAERAAAGRAIARLATEIPCIAAARTLAAYVASDGEPDVELVLAGARASGALVALPRQRADGSLDLVAAAPETPLERAPNGVLEPVGPGLDPARVPRPATLLAPAVALDRNGRRLGRGGGAYDRLIAELRGLGWTIVGICVSADLLDDLPEEPHDERVDAILTEHGFRIAGASAAP